MKKYLLKNLCIIYIIIFHYNFQEYKDMKIEIFTYELLILKDIGFLIHKINQHPHSFLLPYIHSLFNNLNQFDDDMTKKLAQISWGFLNDR